MFPLRGLTRTIEALEEIVGAALRAIESPAQRAFLDPPHARELGDGVSVGVHRRVESRVVDTGMLGEPFVGSYENNSNLWRKSKELEE